MWKIALILFFAASASSQVVNLNCTFVVNPSNEYACRLFDIEVTNPSQNVVFVGQHMEGRSNLNVQAVEIRASNTPFIIQQIFTVFPNIVDLFIHNSNLQSISIPNIVQLKQIDFNRNNISRIANETFSGQRQLSYIKITNSYIQVIEPNAFVGLVNLTRINLAFNRITEIALPTFQTLTNLFSADLEGNLLSRITCNVFGRNDNLEYLWLENNELNEICTMFTRTLSTKVTFLNLSGNKCIDRSFQLGDEFLLILLNNALRTCHSNFVGENSSETRRITFEFQGPIALYDEFGNIIARVN